MQMWWWWLGCGPVLGGAVDTASVTAGSDGPPAREPVAETTYLRDVRPRLNDSCGRCHSAGGSGTGNFLDYTTASAWAEVMVDRVQAGIMPPPTADPSCHPY